MDTLKNKQLLLLGGIAPICDVIINAHRLGIITHETDYLTDSPAKKVANHAYLVSTTDINALQQLCIEQHIDGAFTAYIDSMLPYCQQLCETMNFHFWGNKENIEMCIDKQLFKQACAKSNVPIVPYVQVTDKNYKQHLNDIPLPVVIKPVDNSGSRGVYKCYDAKDLDDFCQKAFTFSKKKELMIERLMPAHSEFSAYYIIYKGVARLVGMGDRYVDIVDDNTAPQAKGMVFPSTKLQRFIEQLDAPLKRFFADNNMNNGFVFVQGFYDDEHIYANEIGYRLNGGYTYKIADYFSHIDIMKQLLSYSLTGQMDEAALMQANPHYNGVGVLLSISLREGTIAKITGNEDIKKIPHVLDFIEEYSVGTTLDAHGTGRQIYAYCHIAAPTFEEVANTMIQIQQTLKVEDTNGNNMLIGILSPNQIHLN